MSIGVILTIILFVLKVLAIGQVATWDWFPLVCEVVFWIIVITFLVFFCLILR